MTPQSTRAFRAAALVLSLAALAGCGTSTLSVSDEALSNGDAFVKVSRSELDAALPDGGAGALGSSSGDAFYLAINKSQLSQRWFLSAFLTQWHPSENVPVRSLGTKVVTFKVQNGKLFVFDATDGKAWSDALDPEVVIEAWPVVTDYAPFNALPGAANYVLVDPSAGLNKFSFVTDELANSAVHFNVDVSFLQNYKPLADGVSFEQVFTGTSDYPAPGYFAYDQPFRGSGTLAMSLRRYAETAGFTPSSYSPSPAHYFGSSNWRYAKNEPRYDRYTIKWPIHAGMQPIEWRISDGVNRFAGDPRLAGVDVRGAIERGVTNWNQAFGFEALRVVPTAPGDSPGDDDKNFIVVDPNPGAGLAFANWRENPNTGEIRGASVYFSSIFVESALWSANQPGPDAGSGGSDAGSGSSDAGSDGGTAGSCAPDMVIAEVYGGNSTTGAFSQDYVVLHNRTDAPVSLGGWSLQYGAASSTNWSVLPLSGTVVPGGFFLVGLQQITSDAGTPLPTPDLTGGLSLSNNSGKVALVRSAVGLSGTCPASPDVVDFVGYGSANCAEGNAAAPTLNVSLAAVRAASGCTDSDGNAADFAATAPAPRSSASALVACTCSAPAPVTPPLPSADGGTLLVAPPPAPSSARLAWDSMTPGDTCALHRQLTAAVPAGMTRKDFIEKVITHTVLHEIGHTLGLRHNFKGSLQNDSVMDYSRDEDAAFRDTPGAYDVQAVQYLYGLSSTPPTLAFCTDEQTVTDAACDRFDATASPLAQDVGPRFTAAVRAQLAETGTLTYADIWSLTRYVRAPADEAQRLAAFNLLMGQVAPPLPADVPALGANATLYADALAGTFLSNLFLDPVAYRDVTQVSPALNDAAFRARVIEVSKNILVNSDGQRSFESRRVAVDVLESLQTYDAYQALIEARASLQTERAGYNALGQALVDDLTRRIDLACSPYFD